MDGPTPWLIETAFLVSSSLSILGRALSAAPLLAFIYLLFLLAYAIGCFKLRPPPDPIMFHSPVSIINLFIFCTVQLCRISNAQNESSAASLLAATPTTSYRPIFTVPSSADAGMYVFPASYSVIGSSHSLREMSVYEGLGCRYSVCRGI